MATAAPGRAVNATTMANRLGWLGLPVLVVILSGLLLWPKPTLAQLISHGDAAFSKSDWSSAYASYLRASQTNPQDSSAHLKLAAVYDQTRHYDQAVNELKLAQQLSPVSVSTDQLGQEMSRRDAEVNLRADLAAATTAVNEHPDFRNGWLQIAYDQYRLKSDQDAKKAAEAALELDPNYPYALKLRQLLP